MPLQFPFSTLSLLIASIELLHKRAEPDDGHHEIDINPNLAKETATKAATLLL